MGARCTLGGMTGHEVMTAAQHAELQAELAELEGPRRAAAVEAAHAPDDRRERLVVVPVGIDGVQARGAARRLVGLRQRLDRKLDRLVTGGARAAMDPRLTKPVHCDEHARTRPARVSGTTSRVAAGLG